MYHSNNIIVRSCFNHAIVDVNSCIGAKFAFLRSLGVDIFKHKLCETIQQVPLSKITVEQQAEIENLKNVDGAMHFIYSHKYNTISAEDSSDMN